VEVKHRERGTGEGGGKAQGKGEVYVYGPVSKKAERIVHSLLHYSLVKDKVKRKGKRKVYEVYLWAGIQENSC
jgi:hypothetical protein